MHTFEFFSFECKKLNELKLNEKVNFSKFIDVVVDFFFLMTTTIKICY